MGARWALLINVPIAVAAGIGLLLPLTADARGTGRVGVTGGILSIAGLTVLTLGLTSAESSGWGSAGPIGPLAGGVLVLRRFVFWQRRTSAPLMPLSLSAERLRTAAFASMPAWDVTILAAFLFLSVYLQQIAGFSPLSTGLSFLPYTAAILIIVRLVRPALAAVPPRIFLAVGLALLAVALLVLSVFRSDAPYWSHALPVFVLLGLSTGYVQPAAGSAAPHRAGPACGSLPLQKRTGSRAPPRRACLGSRRGGCQHRAAGRLLPRARPARHHRRDHRSRCDRGRPRR